MSALPVTDPVLQFTMLLAVALVVQLTVERLHLPGLIGLLLGTLISSHTLLAYPIVTKLDLTHRRSVVAAVGGTLITDTLALVLLAIVIQLETAGPSSTPLESLLRLGLLIAVVAISIVVVPRVSRWVMSRQASQAQKALYVLLVLLLLSTITELIGTEKILGAFLAGLCLNRVLTTREVLREHVEFVGRILLIFVTCLAGPLLTQKIGLFLSRHDEIET